MKSVADPYIVDVDYPPGQVPVTIIELEVQHTIFGDVVPGEVLRVFEVGGDFEQNGVLCHWSFPKPVYTPGNAHLVLLLDYRDVGYDYRTDSGYNWRLTDDWMIEPRPGDRWPVFQEITGLTLEEHEAVYRSPDAWELMAAYARNSVWDAVALIQAGAMEAGKPIPSK